MKKTSRMSIALMAILFMAVAFIKPAVAAGPPDQFCTVPPTGGWTTAIRSFDNVLTQTFKPTENRLSRIILDLQGDGIGTMSMLIGRTSNDKLVGISTNGLVPEPNGRGKAQFLFNDIVLVPGEEYRIWLWYSGGNTTLGWYYQINCYAGGAAYMGKTAQAYDFGFETYGFTYTDPATGEVPTETVVEEAVTVKTESATATANLTEDTALQPPKLEYAIKNNVKVEDLASATELEKEDSLVLFGTGTAGTQVVVKVGDQAYENDVDSAGKWFVEVKGEELEAGDYTVTGQIKKDDKVSESTDLMKVLVKGETKAPVTQSEVTDPNENLYPYYYAILGFLALSFLGVLAYYLIDRKRKASKKKAHKEKVGDSADEAFKVETIDSESNDKQLE